MGSYNASRPTYVVNSAFHHGFAAAIGITESTAGIPIENNIVHRTIDFGIVVAGNSNIIRRNLVMLNYWSSTFITWEAKLNAIYFWGAIDVHDADSVVLEDNYVAGAERIGIFFKGDACAPGLFDPSMNHSIKNNVVVGAMGGVVILPTFFFANLTCIRISGFTVFKSMYWGIYYQGPQSIIIDSNVLVDNQVNVYALVIKPNILLHQMSNKTYLLTNSLIVGKSSTFDCEADIWPSDTNTLFARSITSFSGVYSNDFDGVVGCVWANFISGSNEAPTKPWYLIFTIFTTTAKI